MRVMRIESGVERSIRGIMSVRDVVRVNRAVVRSMKGCEGYEERERRADKGWISQGKTICI